MSNKEKFAARLKGLLDSRLPDLTQKERAKLLGVSQPSLSNILSGDRFVSMETAIDFAQVLNVSVEYLLTGRGPINSKDAALDYLDISELPNDAKVAIRATVHAVMEQTTPYKK